MKKVSIEGMMCQHCVSHVEKALNGIENVESVRVSLEDNCAEVVGAVSDEDIRNAVIDAGYTVTAIE